MQYLNFDKTNIFKKLGEHAKTAAFDFRGKLDAEGGAAPYSNGGGS